MKKILYVDMDNVLVDFPSALSHLSEEERAKYAGHIDDVPNIFLKMRPVEGAIEAYQKLAKYFETYILSTAPWANPTAWADKVSWVQRYLGDAGYKRLILTHNKHLNKGDFLVDDRRKNGADEFEGEFIHFGSEEFPNWETVTAYLLAKSGC